MSAWTDAKLEDLAFFQRGFDITKKQQKPGDVPVVSSSGINSFHNESKLDGPGVIIGRKGTLGTVHFINRPYWPHDTTLWVRDFKGNNPRFVYYFLQVMGFERFDVGGANPTLNRNHIHALPIRKPSKQMQDRIVKVLSSYDGLIQNNRRRIALLEEASKQLYKEWFVRFRFPGHEHTRLVDSPLGNIPKGWQVVETQEIQANKKYALNGGPFGSKLGTKDYVENGVPVIRGANIGGSSRFTTDDFVYVSEHKADTLASNLAHPGDLIFTQRGTLGQVGMIPKKCPFERFIVSQSQMKLTVNEELVEREYVYQFFNSPVVVQRILNHSITSGVPHINLTTLREFKLLLPPRELQAEFAGVVSGYDDFIENTTERNKLLAEARDLLLPRLMSGEVEV